MMGVGDEVKGEGREGQERGKEGEGRGGEEGGGEGGWRLASQVVAQGKERRREYERGRWQADSARRENRHHDEVPYVVERVAAVRARNHVLEARLACGRMLVAVLRSQFRRDEAHVRAYSALEPACRVVDRQRGVRVDLAERARVPQQRGGVVARGRRRVTYKERDEAWYAEW